MPAKSSERKVIYAQRKEKGCCPRCGNKVGKRSKYVFCDECRAFFRDYNKEKADSINKTRKEKYDERKENRLCPRCGKRLGKKYKKKICQICLEKQYEYNYGKKRPVKGK